MRIITIPNFEVSEVGMCGMCHRIYHTGWAEKLNMSAEIPCPTAQSHRMQVLHVNAFANSEIELFASTKKAHSV